MFKNRYIGVLIGGVFSTGFCFWWYSKPIFLQRWMDGMWIKYGKIEAMKEAGLGSTYIATFCAFLFLNLGIQYFVSAAGGRTLGKALGQAFLLWFFFAVGILFLDFLWEFKRFDLLILDSAFLGVVFLVGGSLAYFFRGTKK